MDHCHYCRKEISPGARVCMDCQDYVTAVRVAYSILEDTDLGGALAASVGAEIVREYLLRSMGGARARCSPRSTGEEVLRRRPLL